MLSSRLRLGSGGRPLCTWHDKRRVATASHAGGTATTAAPRVTIVGGGAAGLTAAFFAAEQGAKVTVLERTKECGKKILMSGGSRCNVLPVEYELQRDFFSESSPSALRAVFASWSLDECREWLTDVQTGLGLQLAIEEESQKWFPVSNSSKEVRDKLLNACLRRGVVVRYSSSVEAVYQLEDTTAAAAASLGSEEDRGRAGDASGSSTADSSSSNSRSKSSRGSSTSGRPAGGAGGGWQCSLADGTQHVTDRLVLATGGLSFPLVGTDGTGHKLLRALGHRLSEPYPALTPLTGTHPGAQQLAGVSMYNIELQAVAAPAAAGTAAPPAGKGAASRGRAAKSVRAQRSALLFTHKGFSGPAVLDLSHQLIMAQQRGIPMPELRVNWTSETPEAWDERLRAGGTAMLTTVLQRGGVRERLAEALCMELNIDGTQRMLELRKADRQALVRSLTAYALRVDGHQGYKKAEVTGGGVPLQEVDCASMGSRLLPNLYLCGEVVDVFGRIGGFNFLAAWITGRLAGLGAARPLPLQ